VLKEYFNCVIIMLASLRPLLFEAISKKIQAIKGSENQP
jgi:hypothetical protein